MANRLDRPHSFVVRIENGQNANPPDTQTFNDLARFLELDQARMLKALGYLDVEPGDAAAWDAEIPQGVREVLHDLDWTNPTVATRTLVMLQTVKDTQRSEPVRLHDPSEVERRSKEENGS
jgi:hypothetical protein